MQTFTYSSNVTLTVTQNDNALTCFLNPDSPLNKWVKVYDQHQSNMGAAAKTTADLTPYLNSMLGSGESTAFSAVASNFIGGGQMTFTVTVDGNVALSVNTALPVYNSEQWAITIKRA